MNSLMNLDPSSLARLAGMGVLKGTEALLPSRAVLGLDWPELEGALPDHGLPRGVIEIAAIPRMTPRGSLASNSGLESMRGGATAIAIAAIRAIHAADEHAWCTWITPIHIGQATTPTLYAPALVQAGVDLDRLLVVRPPSGALARTCVKAASSGAFALVVVDAPRAQDLAATPPRGSRAMPQDGTVVVRKLALAAEEHGTTSLLLTSALAARAVPWPVTMRLEVERRPDALAVRIAKDRRGCGSSQHVVRLAS